MTDSPLISAALLGASRMKELPPPPTAELLPVWQSIPLKNPSSALLDALVLTRAMNRAGTQCIEITEAESPCPIDPRQILSAAATDIGLRILEGEFREVLAEWLELATASQNILPSRALPEMLNAATQDSSLRPAIRQLAGERGLWFARRHDNFDWMLADSVVNDDAWDTGKAPERLAWLKMTRTSDHDRAMSAVSAQWSGEEASMRLSIVRLLAENPHPDDATWLEQNALSDRRQEVREMAVIALMGLPASSFMERARQRASQLIKVSASGFQLQMVAMPPETFDPTWTKDGIKEKPPQGIGNKAWWMRQLIACLPLDEWLKIFGGNSEEMFLLPMDPEWREPVCAGWIDAAIRHPARSLPEYSFPWFAGLESWPGGNVPPKHDVLLRILDALPIQVRYRLLDGVVNKVLPYVLLDLLTRCKQAPPAGTGGEILSFLDAAITAHPTTITRPQVRALAVCIPREEIPQRLATLAALPNLSPIAEEFANALEFRRSLALHFQSKE